MIIKRDKIAVSNFVVFVVVVGFYIGSFGKVAIRVERIHETMSEKPALGDALTMRCAHERVERARQKNSAVDFVQIEILPTS